MDLAIKVFVLSAVVRLLIATDNSLLCAGLYAGSAFVLDALFYGDMARVAIMASLIFLVAWVYFWMLSRLDGSPLLWWIVAIGGVGIVFS